MELVKDLAARWLGVKVCFDSEQLFADAQTSADLNQEKLVG